MPICVYIQLCVVTRSRVQRGLNTCALSCLNPQMCRYANIRFVASSGMPKQCAAQPAGLSKLVKGQDNVYINPSVCMYIPTSSATGLSANRYAVPKCPLLVSLQLASNPQLQMMDMSCGG